MNRVHSKKERRRKKRIPLHLEVSYATESRYKVEIMEGELINMTEGEGGICLKMSEQPAVGSRIMLKFALPHSKDLFSTGTIVWVKESNGTHFFAGVRFDLDAEDMEYIRKAV